MQGFGQKVGDDFYHIGIGTKKPSNSLLGSFLPRSPLLVIYEQLFQLLPHSLFVRLDSRLFLFG